MLLVWSSGGGEQVRNACSLSCSLGCWAIAIRNRGAVAVSHHAVDAVLQLHEVVWWQAHTRTEDVDHALTLSEQRVDHWSAWRNQGCLEHVRQDGQHRSEEPTSELQSLMRISYAVFCLKKKTIINI